MNTASAPGVNTSGGWHSSGGPNSLSNGGHSSSDPPQRQTLTERALPIQRPNLGVASHGPPIRGPSQGAPRFPPRGPIPRGLGRPTPFFIREIYKNGFLKRLPYNEKKSSALAKLLRSDRYWVVFSVHDDILPFLELWNEPTEVATRPPHLMFPLALCQHISPSIVPSDNEWSFVVNFETAAIRFSCNSRHVMEEWVECIRMKLGEMGILNPKGNLYSKVPPPQKPPNNNSMVLQTVRNPMSPLPQPPVEAQSTSTNGTTDSAIAIEEVQAQVHQGSQAISSRPRTRTSIVDASDESNQTFTTSIYLNQTPPNTPNQRASKNNIKSVDQTPNSNSCKENGTNDIQTILATSSETNENSSKSSTHLVSSKSTKDNVPKSKKSHHVIPAQSYEQVVIVPPASTSVSSSSIIKSKVSLSKSNPPTTLDVSAKVSTSATATSVYLNKPQEDATVSSGRHVTVIPINGVEAENVMDFTEEEECSSLENRLASSDIAVAETIVETNDNIPTIHHPRQGSIQRDKIEEESYYDAIFEFDENSSKQKSALTYQTSHSTSNPVQHSQSITKAHQPTTLNHQTPIQQISSLSLSSSSVSQQQPHGSPKKRQQSPTRPSNVNIGRQSEPLPPPPPPSVPYENFVLEGDTKERRERERRRRGSREELGSRASPNKNSAASSVSRRCSDRRTMVSSQLSCGANNVPPSQPQKIRKQRGQRSSSLGPLVDDHIIITSKKSVGSNVTSKEPHEISNMLKAQSRATNTNSLESVDSNPRHAVAKCDQKRYEKDSQAAIRAIRASAGPRRPPLNITNPVQPLNSTINSSQPDNNISSSPTTSGASTHPLIGSPPRHVTDLPPGLRPPPYHPLASLQVANSPMVPPSAGIGPHPPHIPLPGLTCQLSFIPSLNNNERPDQRSELSQQQPVASRPCLREQQVLRLRQEIMHPSGVRITLRKKDCQSSLALVEFFGCVWVVGWKQREFPVLYNAFHVGDQILSVSGLPIKTAHEFNKLIKTHQNRLSGSSEPKTNSQQSSSSNPNVSNPSQGAINSLVGPSSQEQQPHVEIIVRRLPFAQGMTIFCDHVPLGFTDNNFI